MVSIPNPIADLPDPTELIRQAIAADLDPSIFTERSFDEAPNSIAWCREPQFLGGSMELFPKQIEVISRFFEDICYFCSDADYVHNVPVDADISELLDRFTFLEYGVCPSCKRNRLEMLAEWQADPLYAKYHQWKSSVRVRPVPPNEFVGVWGQRSGKSFTVATFLWPYILHRFLCVPNLPTYYRMPSNVIFEASFVAPTKAQNKKYVWGYFRNAYDSSPWFRDVRSYFKDEGKRLGLTLYNEAIEAITFPSKNIVIQLLAANSSTLRGGTRICAGIDELGHFNRTDEGKVRGGARSGTEVFVALDNSLQTVRGRAEKRRKRLNDYNTLDGYMFNISSPDSVDDPIMQRAAQADSSFRMFYTHYATWDFHPEEDQDLIREQYSEEVYKRDFCAVPPRASSPFISPTVELKDRIYDSGKPLFTYEMQISTEELSGTQLLQPVLKNTQPDPLTPRVLAIDNGEVGNAFGLCLARYYPEHEGVAYEEFLEVAPYQEHLVDLAWCYNEVVVPLIQTFNILHVVYDRWESGYAVRDLRTNHGIDARRYTLRWKDFDNFRDDLIGSRIWLSTPEIDPEEVFKHESLSRRSRYPRANFQVQLTTVNQFNRKVVKPDYGNDDLFRAAVLAHYTIMANRKEYMKGLRLFSGRRVNGPVAMFFGRSGYRGGGTHNSGMQHKGKYKR